MRRGAVQFIQWRKQSRERERERARGKRARGNRHENSMSQASSTDVPSEQDKHDADHELSECPTCGSRLASLFPKVSGVDAAEREDAEKQKRSTSVAKFVCLHLHIG